MTRLDATSEPSMEDILASIRKIIAEDPPGSRPTPAPSTTQSQPGAAPMAARAPERERLLPFTSRSEDMSAAPVQATSPAAEPYLTSTPQKAAMPGFGNEPFFSPKSASSEASGSSQSSPFDFDVSPSRIEPSFASAANAQETPNQPVEQSANAPAETAVASVDDQLSDLLGEAASVVIRPVAEMAPAPMVAPASNKFGDRMAGGADKPASDPLTSTFAASSPQPQIERPGFTVARDGFIAPANNSSSPSSAAEADPFEFDLGPSPFQAKPAASAVTVPAPTGNSLTARMSASSLDRIAAPSVAATVANASMLENHTEAEAASIVGPAGDAEISAPEVNAPSELIYTAPANIAAPSVAATLAPKSATADVSHAPVGRFIPANAGVAPSKPIDRDVLEVVPPQRNSAEAAPIEVVRVAPEADAQTPPQSFSSSSTAITVHHANGDMRTMEETVAELLRPMLKSWLAENMPRIVERALRRELSEQTMLDKKAAAE